MKVTLSWLKDFVNINVPIDVLCAKMVAIGLEIEEVEYLGDKVTNVVVGQITALHKHENADKLQVCQVDIGEGKIVQIVTAATNIFVGAKVPVSLDGANLATGQHITSGMLRGVLSEGMFCSGEELGITNDYIDGAEVNGILILDKKSKLGCDIRKVVGLDDYLLDVNVTANRPDCNSVYGLAREVAVALGATCKPLDTTYSVTSKKTIKDFVSASVLDTDLCPAYLLRAVDNIKIAPSPKYITSRLAKVGLHGINNIVDITNYVLLEVGQPMHAFDEQELTDKTIVVRRARSGESIVTLDGKKYNLNNDNLVIADKNIPVGLAGIMGGQDSGIKEHTTQIIFEAAKFARENIRHTSRSLGLRSDSSARFEKGVDVYTVKLGLDRALHLISEFECGDIVGNIIDIEVKVKKTRIVEFNFSRIQRLLGIAISEKRVLKILNSLEIETVIEEGVVTCKVPGYREDIERECDIIEELIRIYGYDNIQSTMLEKSHITKGVKDNYDVFVDRIRNTLCGMGYNECITYPFGGKTLYNKLSLDGAQDLSKNIALLNPLGEELSLMRRNLACDILQVCATNHGRKNSDFKLYEVGKTYLADKLPLVELPLEQNVLSLAVSNSTFDDAKQNLLTLLDVFGLKVAFTRSTREYLHCGISAEIFANGVNIGYIGQVHPLVSENFGLNKVVILSEINLDELYKISNRPIKYNAIPKYPSVSRDFAFVIDEGVATQEVMNEIKSLCPQCESVELFDIYRGEQVGASKKSIAVSVEFRDSNKTLSDKDIEEQINKCILVLQEKFGAILR